MIRTDEKQIEFLRWMQKISGGGHRTEQVFALQRICHFNACGSNFQRCDILGNSGSKKKRTSPHWQFILAIIGCWQWQTEVQNELQKRMMNAHFLSSATMRRWIFPVSGFPDRESAMKTFLGTLKLATFLLQNSFTYCCSFPQNYSALDVNEM